MLNFNDTKRWYDQDPTISMAISILRNTSIEHQLLVAKLLLKKQANFDPPVNQEGSKAKLFRLFSRRWYDFDDDLYNAIEFMRLMPIKVQREWAVEIIEYLCNLDGSTPI